MRTIIEERSKNVAIMDVFSRLIQDRIIFIDGDIEEEMANEIIGQMLFLDAQDKKKPITIYISTYGGSVYDGLAIYDVSKRLSAPIKTVCVGKCCSMGAILMLMGSEREGLKHSRIMQHQPSSGFRGTQTDLEIHYKEVEKLKKELYQIISEVTGQPYNKVEKDCDRDYWMTAQEALEYGFLTKVL